MKSLQPFVAVLCACLTAMAPIYAQPAAAPPTPAPQSGQTDQPDKNAVQEDTTPRIDNSGPHWYSRFEYPYQPRVVPPVNVSNSTRIDSLIRAGNLYLSLQDAIALALENNLDIEVERYEFAFANADLLRARSGASIQGIPTTATTGVPNGAIGIIGNANTGLPALGAASSLPLGGSYDPLFTSTVQYGHITTPQQNTVTTGITSLVSVNKTANFGISQSFATGGSVSLGYNNSNSFQNSFQNNFNPATTSNLDLSFSQPLLQGFGLALNNRTIRIARNNLKAADYVFEQQVINVVANVSELYWNLVYFNNDLDVKRRAIAVSTKLLNDNKAQVEVGTLAPISIVQAEAQVASDEQALVQSETNVLQQETILKSTLSRNGLADAAFRNARIIPTDPIRVPDVEPVQPFQDLVQKALDSRPELSQSRIQIDNSKLALQGTRNQLLPQISVIGDLRNNALAGTVNTLPNPSTGFVPVHIADPFFVGGYGDILSQIFGRNFPNYTVGVQLSIPLRNRAAQANMITQELNLRQNELSVQKLINQVRVDVQTALTAVTQARAQYQSAVKARIFSEQSADAEVKKLAVGASTPYNVILMQRDMWAAQDAEVQAQALYIQSRVQLDWAIGATLEKNNVQIDEAKAGHVSRAPTAIPAH
ncbi:MAG TPA: TolC family protein [Bryobacteraceae bacterium]|nr:TolC family protein [Bryobacteraceae bacterium]